MPADFALDLYVGEASCIVIVEGSKFKSAQGSALEIQEPLGWWWYGISCQ